METSKAATDSSQTMHSGLTASARDADPLALAARELVRIAPLVARVEPAPLQHPVEVGIPIRRRHDAVHHRRLAHDVGDPHPRIQRGEGVLEDHLHLEGRLVRGPGLRVGDAPAAEQDVPFRGFEDPRDHPPKGRFPAPGLPDEAHHLALVDPKAHPIDRVNDLFPHVGPEPAGDARREVERLHEALRDVADFDEGGLGHAHQATSGSGPAGIGWKQRIPRPSETVSNGGSARHRSPLRAHRARNAHPGGRFSSDGVIPGSGRAAVPGDCGSAPIR